jgi:hypothetical protein
VTVCTSKEHGLRDDSGGDGGGPHTHPISEVTSLQGSLDGKSATGHGHAIADTTGLQTALDGKAASSHAHAISDTTGLQAALDGKQAAGSYYAAGGALGTPASGTLTNCVGTRYMQQGAQTTKSAAATLTIAELLTGIIQYTGSTATLTLPTGTNIDGGVMAGLPVNTAFEFTVINTGSGPATLATATGLTLVGSMVTTNGTSARYRVRKTNTNTYTVYRV